MPKLELSNLTKITHGKARKIAREIEGKFGLSTGRLCHEKISFSSQC